MYHNWPLIRGDLSIDFIWEMDGETEDYNDAQALELSWTLLQLRVFSSYIALSLYFSLPLSLFVCLSIYVCFSVCLSVSLCPSLSLCLSLSPAPSLCYYNRYDTTFSLLPISVYKHWIKQCPSSLTCSFSFFSSSSEMVTFGGIMVNHAPLFIHSCTYITPIDTITLHIHSRHKKQPRNERVVFSLTLP